MVLTAGERRVLDDGLALILKDLHDDLDEAVAGAYGWPAGLPEDAVLERLVALNRARAAEEARGRVRWLRPEFQIPRFGSLADRAELDLAGGVVHAPVPAGPKPSYPADESLQTAVVVAALARASGPLDAETLAATFKQGRRVAPRIAAVLLSLHGMAIVGTADGGTGFSLRRAA